MKFMITMPGAGKTTKAMSDALVYAKRYPTALITFGEKEAERLTNLYRKEMIGGKLEIISMRRLLNNPKKRFKRMLIDNVDMLLADIFYPHLELRAEEVSDMGRISLVTATGIPVRDLYATKEGAAMLWDIAAERVKIVEDKAALIAEFEHKANELRKGIPDWYKRSTDVSAGSS